MNQNRTISIKDCWQINNKIERLLSRRDHKPAEKQFFSYLQTNVADAALITHTTSSAPVQTTQTRQKRQCFTTDVLILPPLTLRQFKIFYLRKTLLVLPPEGNVIFVVSNYTSGRVAQPVILNFTTPERREISLSFVEQTVF